MTEARSRGHEVTPVSRRPSTTMRTGDATNVEDVASLSEGQDVLISATRPAPGSGPELVAAAKALLAGTKCRLLLVGGAASLRVADGTILSDTPDFPAEIREIALACNEQLAACRAASDVDWTYLSPPASLEPGVRTGSYRVGADDLLVDANGLSSISVEDFAVALVDEAERPRHRGTRFTVGY
ncbi:NAD(P)-dependent oxidoreductase [Amycolatopsis sp. cg5]|uniref:NAD(P)-dependent oxidoreductase n=1 Tax=Amycolatopsis sp. cg5 TaxID=3238802 RepID=UPI0035252A14